ncbi:hypothetical protein L6E_27840 (plasmid) [Enterococcus hirae]|nr:hypothetical protein GVanDAA620_29780 [Enterococcus faecium]BCZ38529.1 hypothetical protein GVanDAA622_32200 [Enterococcus faecium]BDX48370.1 hypothetical protein L6E_27840 [Enterococcus hirae]GMB97214.1 hypothetical protein K2D_02280 [Enterococcus hirae]GMC07760.1 hypothetical protein K4F_27660 [Enterococcus hirae]
MSNPLYIGKDNFTLCIAIPPIIGKSLFLNCAFNTNSFDIDSTESKSKFPFLFRLSSKSFCE